MKLSTIKPLMEQVDEARVAEWMANNRIKKYELHDDGYVTLSGPSFHISLGDPTKMPPFIGIRYLAGSVRIQCYGNSSSRLDKFIQRSDFGTVTVTLSEPSPLLSLARIKGSSRIHVYVWGRLKNGTHGQLLDLGNELSQDLNDIRDGAVDMLEIQQKWMDAGLGAYAKL